MVFGILFFLPLFLIGILGFVFWLITLIDSATRKFKNSSDKIVWVLVIVLTGLIGSLIYYFVVYSKDKNKSMKWFWWTLAVLVLVFIVFAVIILVRNNAVIG